MKSRQGGLKASGAGRRAQEAGYAAILVSILVPTVFLGLAALAVDTARWYLEMERVQEAADAAALAGVPFLPQDLTNARARALVVSARNGYDNADADVEVTVETGSRDTQLRVTISARISNQFGAMIGVPRATISRTAVADFTGPAPMGSPCNVFGTEPLVGGGTSGSAIGSTRPTNCPQDPELWASVEGPQTGKVQGDRYGTTNCETAGVDGCDGSRKNIEYEQKGYFWLIRVEPGMVNKPLNLEIYDPAFVRQGQLCSDLNGSTPRLPRFADLVNNMNPFVTDGKVRYAHVPSIPAANKPVVPFCTGDAYAGSATGSTNKMTTTFMVREQTDTQDPMRAPVQNDTAGQPCAKQFGSYTTWPTFNALRSTSGSYNAELARVFHNWVSVCTFTPTRSGDYYLHVRTNKHFNFTGTTLMRQVPSGSLSSVAGASGDSSPTGGGSNSFGIRAVVPAGQERNVAVSGWDRMPIYANSEAAETTFNLIRVLPGAAGQFISFDFFDAGDAATAGRVQVLPPTDALSTGGGSLLTPFPAPGCTSIGGSAGSGQTLTNCTAVLTRSGTTATNNGKVQTINIPIPSDYTCDATVLTNCWYRVKISFGSGEVHDVTTWDAEIVGDPVRLIE